MKKLVSVAWVFKDDHKILCVKSKGKDKYFIPGGKLESGESHESGLIREIKEELNIDLIPDTISHDFTIIDTAYGLDNTELEMHCYSAAFNGEIIPASEIESLKWIDEFQVDECAPAAQKVVLKLLQ
ncbi:NUDIX hydrolase [Plesiomonas shigelloides]|uniref:8-oxo-dGTP diphosphatase n=1 Tax=Plesiomonas shigelloides TaxID=703 RepID=A0A8I1WAX6_PLESH|nr:NUDIX domain-containing protein [Plesiomonas shigelloides]KAB7681703.1 NUDIX domain-containing protein [Plesiomonas shigelloides]MBO1109370.1 NUDIX domain-containing protein [Plesiomonas shigelloides]